MLFQAHLQKQQLQGTVPESCLHSSSEIEPERNYHIIRMSKSKEDLENKTAQSQIDTDDGEDHIDYNNE